MNRWRGQLGLAPVTEAGRGEAADALMSPAARRRWWMFPARTRDRQTARLVGVVLPLGGQTWFYKLMGDADIVAQQKDALMQFVQSAKYPDAH